MSTQELVTSIVAEQEESTDQFVNILQQKIEDAIEVKRIELASQMFAEASKKCPECGKADCECDDEDYEDEEEDDEEEMKEEAEQVDEMAPPGAKYERMIKHIKKAYSKGGLTKNEKSIAYATAWKAKNKEMSEAAMTDAQQMAALGMKGADKAKTMTALAAYRKHGDINKLSAGHRSLIAGYMEKTGGLAAVSRGTATQALKKERMQEE